MRIFFILSIAFLLLLVAQEKSTNKPTPETKRVSITAKKQAFFQKIVPVIEKVYKERHQEYEAVKKALKNHTQSKKITLLKKRYGVKSDAELLYALKPHPVSIAIAQAAMESAWGRSRFFREANNIFGMWSINAKQKRIAAGSKRGKQTIWLRKFDSLEEAVRDYYFMLSSKKAYRRFKELNSDEVNSVYKILNGLLPYSERKEAYIKELANIIRHNKLTRYDTQVAKKSL